MHPRIAIVPTTGASGVRKVRGASGARRRITSMHTETPVNAASVPALARAAIASIGASPAIPAPSTARQSVLLGKSFSLRLSLCFPLFFYQTSHFFFFFFFFSFLFFFFF